MALRHEDMAMGLLLLLQGKSNWEREKQKIFQKLVSGMELKQHLRQDEDKF